LADLISIKQINDERIVQARKPHVCMKCRVPIRAGASYYGTEFTGVSPEDGKRKYYSEKRHTDCAFAKQEHEEFLIDAFEGTFGAPDFNTFKVTKRPRKR